MFRRKRARNFEVLGQRFVLPTLALEPRLDRAATMRKRLGATWFEAAIDPVVGRFRSPSVRTRVRFARAHRVLSAHEAVVHAALDHVAIYDDALVRATQHAALRSREKIDDLLGKAAERRQIAQRVAHLATRVEHELERDLALIADRIRGVGRAAHLILLRLHRYRAFVRRTLASLTARESQLAAQRALLVHDEHTFELGRELAEDRDFARWMVEPDALCAGIERNLRALLTDLDGLEGGLTAVPEAMERLLAKAADASHDDAQGQADLELDFASVASDTALSLPSLSEIPERLDDDDWDALEAHELESAVVFRATSVEALGVEVHDWLDARSGTGKGLSRRCATCANAVISGAALGRAHVLCVTCRERGLREGNAWLRNLGFNPQLSPDGRSYSIGAVTRAVFESVMGWVPSPGPADSPVTDLTWYEAIELCNALSRREGRKPAYRVRGETVVRRLGPDIDGWRLPDADAPTTLADVRVWAWGRVESDARPSDARPVRRLSGGLRPISGGRASDRAVPEAREPDLGLAITCAHIPRVATARPPRVTPPSRRPSPSPTPVRAASPHTARRVTQATLLAMLVTGASVAVLSEVERFEAPNAGETLRLAERPVPGETPAPAETPAPSATPAQRPATSEPVAAPPAANVDESAFDRAMEDGYAARVRKDRKSARKAFERAVEVQPEDLGARYEAAREAAQERDAKTAFAHLEPVRAHAVDSAKARQVLSQALIEPDFARLRRDPRWKAIEAATRL
ncbi:MAG: hypothetical protein JNJ59_21490 [Deltaproteobacteria bacterium]|nr:hypothetical protein [Deltaproteobacteria bacterium]